MQGKDQIQNGGGEGRGGVERQGKVRQGKARQGTCAVFSYAEVL